jgi:hypothetical protein
VSRRGRPHPPGLGKRPGRDWGSWREWRPDQSYASPAPDPPRGAVDNIVSQDGVHIGRLDEGSERHPPAFDDLERLTPVAKGARMGARAGIDGQKPIKIPLAAMTCEPRPTTTRDSRSGNGLAPLAMPRHAR